MNVVLTREDIVPLTPEQKTAVLNALFVALIADGRPSHEEQARFAAELGTLPWGKTPEEYQTDTQAFMQRLATSTREEKLAFLKEVAETIPGADLREKVILAMTAIVAADRKITDGERASISAFVISFGLGEDAIERIAAKAQALTSVAAEAAPKVEVNLD